MLTAFGKFSRKLRIDKQQILRDMAKNLGVTSAYLSAVELGKRPVPSTWESKLAEAYNMSNTMVIKLKKSIQDSAKDIRINLDSTNENQRDAAFMFARKINELDDRSIKEISEIINKGGK